MLSKLLPREFHDPVFRTPPPTVLSPLFYVMITVPDIITITSITGLLYKWPDSNIQGEPLSLGLQGNLFPPVFSVEETGV